MENKIFKINNLKFDKRGVAALLTVIIVSASVLLIAFSASILGMGEMDMGYTSQKGQESYSLVNGCAEEALRQIQFNSNWGGGTLNLSGGTCIIAVISDSNNRIITISSNINNFSKKLQVLVSVNNGIITLNSWQEIEN